MRPSAGNCHELLVLQIVMQTISWMEEQLESAQGNGLS